MFIYCLFKILLIKIHHQIHLKAAIEENYLLGFAVDIKLHSESFREPA